MPAKLTTISYLETFLGFRVRAIELWAHTHVRSRPGLCPNSIAHDVRVSVKVPVFGHIVGFDPANEHWMATAPTLIVNGVGYIIGPPADFPDPTWDRGSYRGRFCRAVWPDGSHEEWIDDLEEVGGNEFLPLRLKSKGRNRWSVWREGETPLSFTDPNAQAFRGEAFKVFTRCGWKPAQISDSTAFECEDHVLRRYGLAHRPAEHEAWLSGKR